MEADPRRPFAAKFEGEKCVIRLIDFPDEHLYTLIVDGEEVVAFDDWSASWNRPAKEKSVSQPAPSKHWRGLANDLTTHSTRRLDSFSFIVVFTNTG